MRYSHAIYIRLYRVIDYSDDVVDKELRKLGEFIKQRAHSRRDVSYIALTYVNKDLIDGLLIIMSNDIKRASIEAELITDFIRSNLESLSAKIIDKPKALSSIMVPRPKRFFVGKTGSG